MGCRSFLQGRWQLAEAVFAELEGEALSAVDASTPSAAANAACLGFVSSTGVVLFPSYAANRLAGCWWCPANLKLNLLPLRGDHKNQLRLNADGASPWTTSNSDGSALPLLLSAPLAPSNAVEAQSAAAPMQLSRGGSSGNLSRASSACSYNPLEAYGLLPTSLAEEVCDRETRQDLFMLVALGPWSSSPCHVGFTIMLYSCQCTA